MKEVVFIRQNIDKWRKTEQTVEDFELASPDELADAYIDVTSDLAFAQTHYPDSRITLYLNNLASALHNELYRNKREKWSRILTFWTREVPDTMWEARRELLSSLLIFVASALLGVLSQWLDADFARFVLGDRYVEMTLDNIAVGDPMGVYNSQEGTLMFIGITTNNVWVSFLVFALGALTSFATGWILFQNGLMVGTFQTFFAQQGLLWPSFLAIWLHGTLEISAIVVAGAAGLAMGNSLLFPGTYSRLTSFRRGAKRGLRIIVGIVPIFIAAALIESFMTRHTEWPDGVRLAVILTSAAFIIYYFIILPFKRNYQHGKETDNALQDADVRSENE